MFTPGIDFDRLDAEFAAWKPDLGELSQDPAFVEDFARAGDFLRSYFATSLQVSKLGRWTAEHEQRQAEARAGVVPRLEALAARGGGSTDLWLKLLLVYIQPSVSEHWEHYGGSSVVTRLELISNVNRDKQ